MIDVVIYWCLVWFLEISYHVRLPNPNPNPKVQAKIGTNELLNMMPSTWVKVNNLRLSTAWCDYILIGKKTSISNDINDKMSAWYMHVILMQRQRKMWYLRVGQASLLDAATICDIGPGGVWQKQNKSDCVNGLKCPQHLHIYTHTHTPLFPGLHLVVALLQLQSNSLFELQTFPHSGIITPIILLMKWHLKNPFNVLSPLYWRPPLQHKAW